MFKVFNRCLTSRTSSHDQTKINILQIFHDVINRVHVDFASLLWWDFLHCVQQKKDVIQYPRFTMLIIADLMKKNVTIKGMLILDDLLADDIVGDQRIKELCEGVCKDEESYSSKFIDFVFLDEEDSGTSIEPKSHKENPKEVDDDEEEEEKKDDKKNDDGDDDNDDHDYHALVRTRRT
ncbi:hypothetical protein Tco_1068755 [Tanacetum coccineum]|uniref:Uncharacterized protein n=1 Tax=Tanacetum coccineum TaxID=301880 RepID=A0ABQ5HIQ9_9ASTR